ncbi:MAG: hypothetical protein GDA43_15055 [Hormoscilla sp. SP5CHS1]|nr:hypothetical protein [Hormoscilla sp. SP12CHS1]MBC6454352.1 hypothetical protein [Hormoscilla sp. SP5CHS1]MBC6471750.1 hypothetical protein [Hormoscilla sp. GM102CHS1]
MGPLKNLFGGKKGKSGKDTKFSVKFGDQGQSSEPAAPATAETTPAVSLATAKAEALQAKKAKMAAIKAEKAAAKKGKTVAPKQPQPTAAKTAAKAPEPESANFAPTYLNPANALNAGRRRPGPSMNSFMTMARQAKIPKVTPKLPKTKK